VRTGKEVYPPPYPPPLEGVGPVANLWAVGLDIVTAEPQPDTGSMRQSSQGASVERWTALQKETAGFPRRDVGLASK